MKKKYFQIILICLAAIFMLTTITLFIRISTLQEETKEPTEIVRINEDTDLERKAHAYELLALAQNAYYQNDQRNFQGHMATLESYADVLSDEALEIYHELENALRGKNND